jgi:hypothetical protein
MLYRDSLVKLHWNGVEDKINVNKLTDDDDDGHKVS